MATDEARASVQDSIGSYESCMLMKQRQLDQARQLYGNDVLQLDEASGTKEWILFYVKEGSAKLFGAAIKRAILKKDMDLSTPFKIVITGCYFDVVITISEKQIRVQFYGDPKYAGMDFYQLQHHSPIAKTTVSFDFTVPTKQFVRAIADDRFNRALNRINSTAPSPLDLF